MTATKKGREKSDLRRLAEIIHIRLREEYKPQMGGEVRRSRWYVCQLCNMATPAGLEISHDEYCPIEKLK